MQKIKVANRKSTFQVSGKPTIPLMGKQPIIETRTSDPSSTAPKGERYPIPSFFEYRIKPKEYDTL